MSGPLGEVGRPTRFSHRESRAFAPGIRGGTNQTTLPLPQRSVGLNGPGFNSQYASGNTHADSANDGIVQETNARTMNHQSQIMYDWQEGDTCADSITFIEHNATAIKPDWRLTNNHMLAMYELNRRLQHDRHMRAKYGVHKHAHALRKDWTFNGVMHTKDTDIHQLGENAGSVREVVLVVDGRCNMPNVALERTQGIGVMPSVNELNTIYLVWTRHLYEGEAAVMDWDSIPEPNERRVVTRKSIKRRRELDTIDEEESVHSSRHPGMFETADERSARVLDMTALRASMIDVDAVDDESIVRRAGSSEMRGAGLVAATVALKSVFGSDTPDIHPLQEKRKGKEAEYYWRISTFVSHTRSPPPPQLWCAPVGGDPHNQFVGDYDLLGQVVHRTRGPNNRTPDQVKYARTVTYHEKRGGSYLNEMAKLDRIELFVRQGGTGF